MDNWQHRSENMRCSTCMWYSKKEGDIGRCKKRSPTLEGFPVVFSSDWCGDHKLVETQINIQPNNPFNLNYSCHLINKDRSEGIFCEDINCSACNFYKFQKSTTNKNGRG